MDLRRQQWLRCQGGWENDETVREAAAREAVEEAGVRGILMVKPLSHSPFQILSYAKNGMLSWLKQCGLVQPVPGQTYPWFVWPMITSVIARKAHRLCTECVERTCRICWENTSSRARVTKTNLVQKVSKAAMYALYVKEELESCPEQETRTRTWLTIPEALEKCWHDEMCLATRLL